MITSPQIKDYLLSDYQFLEDYEVLDSARSNRYSFVAHIRHTSQKVRFIKHRFSLDQLVRFKILHKLYKNGIVLADNMFILQQCEQLYFYIIEAQIQIDNPRFQTLQMYLYTQEIQEEQRKNIVSKVKILIDCLHQQGQAYAGLDPRRILIDQEGHLYLAPFDLEMELKTDSYSRAYYPPECLRKLQKRQCELTQELTLKWDIWSFGCVALQILKYASPIFLATSINKQINLIQRIKMQQITQQFQDSLQNIVANSLNTDIAYRTISIHKIHKKQIIQKEVQSQLVSQSNSTQNNCSQNLNKGGLRELNLRKNQQQGDSEFVLNLFSLSNINFQRELHITVNLGKKFHFYIDSLKEDSKKYQLGRKISLRADFQQLSALLATPILIQLEEGGKQASICVNLQTLVLVHEGRRIWNQQLLGTYAVDQGEQFKGAKLKISSILISPEVIDSAIQQEQKRQCLFENNNVQQHVQIKKTVKSEKNVQKYTQKQKYVHKKKIKDQQNIPSISQIAENVVNFTNEFKKKMSLSDNTHQDQIQTQLQTLLQIK